MQTVSITEWIEFPRSEVYRAGIRTETWPGVNGLIIESEADEIVLGGLIRARLNIPGIKLGIDCSVTDLIPNELVHIEGRSRTAQALLHFELSDDEQNSGTYVAYTFGLEPKSFIARAASPAVRMFVEKAVPEFAHGFRQNVTEYLTV